VTSEEIEEAANKAEPNVTDKTGEWTSDGAGGDLTEVVNPVLDYEQNAGTMKAWSSERGRPCHWDLSPADHLSAFLAVRSRHGCPVGDYRGLYCRSDQQQLSRSDRQQ
jgi:hypothetical protein